MCPLRQPLWPLHRFFGPLHQLLSTLYYLSNMYSSVLDRNPLAELPLAATDHSLDFLSKPCPRKSDS